MKITDPPEKYSSPHANLVCFRPPFLLFPAFSRRKPRLSLIAITLISLLSRSITLLLRQVDGDGVK